MASLGANTGGRPEGSRNKIQAKVKQVITDFVENQVNNLDRVFAELEPKEQLDFIVKLLPYIIRKEGIEGVNTMVNINQIENRQINFNFTDSAIPLATKEEEIE